MGVSSKWKRHVATFPAGSLFLHLPGSSLDDFRESLLKLRGFIACQPQGFNRWVCLLHRLWVRDQQQCLLQGVVLSCGHITEELDAETLQVAWFNRMGGRIFWKVPFGDWLMWLDAHLNALFADIFWFSSKQVLLIELLAFFSRHHFIPAGIVQIAGWHETRCVCIETLETIFG